MIKLLLAVLSLAAIDMASAQGMDGAAKENYKNPDDTKGLCQEKNKDEWQSKRGFCLAIKEQLTLKGCAKDAIEEIRKRILATESNQETDPKKQMSMGGLACNTKDRKNMDDIAKNPEAFAYMLTQYFSIIAIEESDWNDLANKGSATEGLLGLKKAEMKKKEYSCGCDTRQQPNIKPDRPLDGHQNMICGMYMALYNAKKDGTLKGSKPSDPPKPNQKNEPLGFSRIFKSVEDVTDIQKDKAGYERRKRMNKKFETFCKSFSTTGEWKRELPDIGAEALKNPPAETTR